MSTCGSIVSLVVAGCDLGTCPTFKRERDFGDLRSSRAEPTTTLPLGQGRGLNRGCSERRIGANFVALSRHRIYLSRRHLLPTPAPNTSGLGSLARCAVKSGSHKLANVFLGGEE